MNEAGQTLLDVVIGAGIVALVGLTAYGSLAQRPAAVRATIVETQALVAQARALAAGNAGDPITGADGATLAIVPEGNGFVATLYVGRPVPGAPAPLPARNVPPVHASVPLALGDAAAWQAPPFALVFAASGRVVALPGFTPAVSAPPVTEPACPAGGVVLGFGAAPIASRAIDCASGVLDSDTPAATP